MTLHDPYNEDLSLQGLEPGEDNPLDHEPTYNPLRHCYPMTANVDDIEYEIAVKFQLQMHGETTPIDFINPRTSKPHSINFFPKIPEIALEPKWDGPQPNLTGGYQIGESSYYLVPTVCRCKHIEEDRLLTREAAIHLISPEVLQAAILTYRNKIEEDPDAPAILHELLNMWDPGQAYLFDDDEEDDPWTAPDMETTDEDEDHYDEI